MEGACVDVYSVCREVCGSAQSVWCLCMDINQQGPAVTLQFKWTGQSYAHLFQPYINTNLCVYDCINHYEFKENGQFKL